MRAWCPSSGGRWWWGLSVNTQVAEIYLRCSGAWRVAAGVRAMMPAGAQALMPRSRRFATIAGVLAWCPSMAEICCPSRVARAVVPWLSLKVFVALVLAWCPLGAQKYV